MFSATIVASVDRA